MDHQSLSNVLGMLRKLKDEPNNITGIQLIQKWTGVASTNPAAVLTVAVNFVEQIREATIVIENSSLSEEAKAGVRVALKGLENAFALTGLQSHTKGHIPHIEVLIGNFAILLDASGIDSKQPIPQEAVDLANEVDALSGEFDDESLDPVLRDIAKRHLATLSTLLRHVPIFGLEAALATYFELVIRLRRAGTNTSEESQKAAKPLFEKLESLKEKFETIDKIWNIGVKWIGAGKGVGALLLTFIPH
jgi:hypothetical protein